MNTEYTEIDVLRDDTKFRQLERTIILLILGNR